jgi:hypothetical protein
MSLIKSIKFIGTNTQVVNQLMQEAFKVEGSLKVTIEPWSDKRTLSANAQIYVWYAQIAKKDGESVDVVRNFCKLMFGLPILMGNPSISGKLKWTLDKIGFFGWQHEQQCNFMDMLAVSSLMTTKEHNQYRDNILAYYNKNGYALDYQD